MIKTLIPGFNCTDHTFTAPLDYAKPNGAQIRLFAREVTQAGRNSEQLPWLVFFQGGPGGTTTRPHGDEGWLKRAVRDYRVLLLDQRGTGRSTPATAQSLARLGDASEIAGYLKHFRADNIVRDAEHIRKQLIGGEKWSILGQSFGGFCAATYLSFAPQGLREAFITGGLPPLVNDADPVYRQTYKRVLEKNDRFYARYPGNVQIARDIANELAANDVRLPNGDRLSVRRFQQLGFHFGTHDGFETVHYILERAFDDEQLSFNFLSEMQHTHNFETNPIFCILHEACYAQGAPTRWSAERLRRDHAMFDASEPGALRFTGEMIYPWMFDEYSQLRPLKRAADILADFDGWPALYDEQQLRANTVPVAAAMYYNDMYVDRELSQRTADAIQGIKVWVTSEYEHNGLRASGEHVLGRLMALLRGEVSR